MVNINNPLSFITIWLVLLTVGMHSYAQNPTSKPSILVFVADDAGWMDSGAYGNEYIRTPNIDQLAASGLLVETAILTTPQCSPSRISILSGRYPHATGAEDLHMPLPADSVLLPTYLQEAGYFTGHLKKTHYGPEGEKQFEFYDPDLDAFGEFLDAADGRPFFMWVGFTDPHRPYQEGSIAQAHDPDRVFVPPYLADTPETRVDLALYYDEIARMDSVIGSYVNELERREMRDNTLIVFLSDNGAPFPRAKGSLYDAGIRTPLVFSWPAVIEPGSRYGGLVSVIDLAPTLLDIAGYRPMPSNMQGSSIRAAVEEQNQLGRIHAFSERNWHNADEHMRSVRTDRYKLIHNAYRDRPHGTASDIAASPSWQALYERKLRGELTDAQARLFEVPRARIELYDLEKDPWELINVAGDPAYADVVRDLFRVLEEWRAETGDFPPEFRQRDDNVDRITGAKFTMEIPPMRDSLSNAK